MTMSDVGDDDDLNDATASEGSGEDSDDVPMYVRSVIPPLKPVKEIKNEMAELRLEDDRAFVKQMILDPYFLKVTKEMFDNGTNHVWMKHDESKQSLFMTIARDLERRADYCVILAQEISSGDYDYDLDVVKKVDGIITSTEGLLAKFVLTKEEEERDVSLRDKEGRKETETLFYTHYNTITEAYNMMKKHHKKLLQKFYTLEKLEVEKQEDGKPKDDEPDDETAEQDAIMDSQEGTKQEAGDVIFDSDDEDNSGSKSEAESTPRATDRTTRQKRTRPA